MSVTSSKEWFSKGTKEVFCAHEPCRRASHLLVSSLLLSSLTDVPVGHDYFLIVPYSANHLLDLLTVTSLPSDFSNTVAVVGSMTNMCTILSRAIQYVPPKPYGYKSSFIVPTATVKV